MKERFLAVAAAAVLALSVTACSAPASSEKDTLQGENIRQSGPAQEEIGGNSSGPADENGGNGGGSTEENGGNGGGPADENIGGSNKPDESTGNSEDESTKPSSSKRMTYHRIDEEDNVESLLTVVFGKDGKVNIEYIPGYGSVSIWASYDSEDQVGSFTRLDSFEDTGGDVMEDHPEGEGSFLFGSDKATVVFRWNDNPGEEFTAVFTRYDGGEN